MRAFASQLLVIHDQIFWVLCRHALYHLLRRLLLLVLERLPLGGCFLRIVLRRLSVDELCLMLGEFLQVDKDGPTIFQAHPYDLLTSFVQ